MGYPKGYSLVCHYYPPCPEPDLTLRAKRHSDPSFLTVVLQDQIPGLQVFHVNQWVDVQPIAGSLLVNIEDFLQITSNDKFRSVDHRVVSKLVGPRVCVACFFSGYDAVRSNSYGQIKESTSKENPSVYREFLTSEYRSKYYPGGVVPKSGID